MFDFLKNCFRQIREKKDPPFLADRRRKPKVDWVSSENSGEMLIVLLGIVELLFYLCVYSIMPVMWAWTALLCTILILIIWTEHVIKTDQDPVLPALLRYPLDDLVKRDELGFYLGMPHGYFGDCLFFQFFLSDPARDSRGNIATTKPRFFIASELYAFPFIAWIITLRGGRPAERDLIFESAKMRPRLYGLLLGGAREIRIAYMNTSDHIYYYERDRILDALSTIPSAQFYTVLATMTHRCGIGCKGPLRIQNFFQKLIGHSFPVFWLPLGFHFEARILAMHDTRDGKGKGLADTLKSIVSVDRTLLFQVSVQEGTIHTYTATPVAANNDNETGENEADDGSGSFDTSDDESEAATLDSNEQ